MQLENRILFIGCFVSISVQPTASIATACPCIATSITKPAAAPLSTNVFSLRGIIARRAVSIPVFEASLTTSRGEAAEQSNEDVTKRVIRRMGYILLPCPSLWGICPKMNSEH